MDISIDISMGIWMGMRVVYFDIYRNLSVRGLEGNVSWLPGPPGWRLVGFKQTFKLWGQGQGEGTTTDRKWEIHNDGQRPR